MFDNDSSTLHDLCGWNTWWTYPVVKMVTMKGWHHCVVISGLHLRLALSWQLILHLGRRTGGKPERLTVKIQESRQLLPGFVFTCCLIHTTTEKSHCNPLDHDKGNQLNHKPERWWECFCSRSWNRGGGGGGLTWRPRSTFQFQSFTNWRVPTAYPNRPQNICTFIQQIRFHVTD